MDDILIAVAVWLGGLLVFFLILYFVIKWAVRAAMRPRPAYVPHGYQNRWRIEGLERATKKEVAMVIAASSEAMARAKAELDGIIVTDVEWHDYIDLHADDQPQRNHQDVPPAAR